MQRFAIQGYPHICHMRQGQTRDYVGDRSLEDVSVPLIKLLLLDFPIKLLMFWYGSLHAAANRRCNGDSSCLVEACKQ